MNKWFAIPLGTLLGLSHIGMINMISQGNKLPRLNLPINEYTSYNVEANKDGYRINYRAHDPKVMVTLEKGERPGGFLGLGKKKSYRERQYMAEGRLHLEPHLDEDGNALTANQIACIKAQGSGESTGRLVGGGLGTAVVANTTIASIPVVGWVLAGATTMLGMNQGAEIGGQMAADLSDACDEVDK